MRTSALLAGGAMAMACSRGPSSSAGSGGDAFTMRDQVAQRYRSGGDQLLIQLVSLPGVCALYNAGAPAPSRDYDIITIELQNTKGPLAVGKRDVTDAGSTDGGHAQAHFVGNRGCRMYYAGPATGTFEITDLDDHHVAGSYALTFDKGWPFSVHDVAGSFDLVFCAISPDKVPTITCK